MENVKRLFSSRQMRLLLFGLVFAIAGAIIFVTVQASREPTSMVRVGRVDDFPPGSVTEFELKTVFADPMMVDERSPVPIFLVHDPTEGFLALYNRDPYLGCHVTWVEASQRFMDPCHGGRYTLTGEYLEGPAPHGLDRFEIIVTSDEEVVVDVSQFLTGPPRPEK